MVERREGRPTHHNRAVFAEDPLRRNARCSNAVARDPHLLLLLLPVSQELGGIRGLFQLFTSFCASRVLLLDENKAAVCLRAIGIFPIAAAVVIAVVRPPGRPGFLATRFLAG